MSTNNRSARMIAAAGLLASLLPAGAAAACIGDCDGNGAVVVNELILGVNIALGSQPVSACGVFDADGSRAVEVYELVGAVGNALAGCPAGVLRRPSRSSSIAITDDDAWVVMTNPDDDSLSIFDADTLAKAATVRTGDEPAAVVLTPDGATAFVANRAAATVVEVRGVRGAGGAVARTIAVGAEPVALALSPSGAKLFVAEWGEGRVSVWDTRSLDLLATIDAPLHPRGLVVTNDGDADDADETLLVSEFYGEPNPDVSGCPNGTAEVCDKGRVGRVRRYRVSDYQPQPAILFQPIDSGFAPAGSAAGTPSVFTAPNQLYALAVAGGRVFATSVSASPQGPINFQTNVHPVLYAGDLASGQEDRSARGSANLARLAEDAIQPATSGQKRFFLQEIVDLDFLGDSAYVISRAADVLQRVNYTASGITVGTPEKRQIDLAAAGGPPACQNPIGVVTSSGRLKAYVNCWITRRLAVVDLTTQTVEAAVQSTDLPVQDSLADQQRRGARFYFTGRGRWSKDGDGYSSCGSCHADGLSDNITWAFGSGPRQSTSMDGSFSHGPGGQKQRAFNWSGIFDEVHDFERNTRGVSGGLGAITTSATNQCGTLAQEQAVDVGGDGLGNSVKEIQDTTAGICVRDWDDIEAFVRTIRPPRALRTLDAATVTRGAQLFQQGNCAACHGGAGWTVSRRFFLPSAATNAALKATPFEPPNATPIFATHDTQIAPQPVAEDNTGTAIPPNQVACVLRDVGTFGLPGDAAGTDALEKKVDNSRAQGAGGYNVPSLYGLEAGAPYLHHGQVRTLKDLFTDNRWAAHRAAGKAGFAPTSAQVDDLVAYLLSIDAATPEVALPAGADACPATFPAAASAEALRDSIPEHDETPDPQAQQTFVGRVAGTNALIAVVADGQFAAGYVCDGAQVSEWFLGEQHGDQLALDGERGGSIDATRNGGGFAGNAALDGVTRAIATVPAVEGQSGLYRTLETLDGVTTLTGWIFADGEWRGADEDTGKRIVGSISANDLPATTGSGTGVGQPVPLEFDCDQEWCNHENTRCLISGLFAERDQASGKRKKMIIRMIGNAQDRLNEIGNNLTFEGCAQNGSSCGDGYDSAQDTPCCDANGCE